MRHGGPALRPQPSHSPCGMIDGVGNRGGGADDPDFANPLRTYRIDIRVILVDPGHVNRADIGAGRHRFWSIEDPPPRQASPSERLEQYRRIRDTPRTQIDLELLLPSLRRAIPLRK